LIYFVYRGRVVGTILQQNSFNEATYEDKMNETMNHAHENLTIEMGKAKTM